MFFIIGGCGAVIIIVIIFACCWITYKNNEQERVRQDTKQKELTAANSSRMSVNKMKSAISSSDADGAKIEPGTRCLAGLSGAVEDNVRSGCGKMSIVTTTNSETQNDGDA